MEVGYMMRKGTYNRKIIKGAEVERSKAYQPVLPKSRNMRTESMI